MDATESRHPSLCVYDIGQCGQVTKGAGTNTPIKLYSSGNTLVMLMKPEDTWALVVPDDIGTIWFNLRVTVYSIQH